MGRLLTFAFAGCASLALMAGPGFATDAVPSSGAPPAPGTTTVTSTPTPKHKGLDPNAIICKRETETGSHIGGEEVCLTRAQWDQQRQNDEDALRRMDQAPQAAPGMRVN
jgi:hypothetical protein